MTQPPDDRPLGGPPVPDEPQDRAAPADPSTPPAPPGADGATAEPLQTPAADATSPSPAGSTGDVPAGPTGDVPAGPTGDVPAGPTGDVPAEPTGDVPAEPTGDVPAEPTGDVPADADRPAGTVASTTGDATPTSDGSPAAPPAVSASAATPTAVTSTAAGAGSTVVAPSSDTSDADAGDRDDAVVDEPRPARRRSTGLLPVAGAAAAVVLLGLLGWLAWELRQDSLTDSSREQSLRAARDAARVLFSYDHESLQADFEAGLEVTTGTFREEYERTTREVVQPVAEEYDAVVEAEVVEAAVVSAEPDRAVALVFLNQTTTSTRVEGPKIDQSRVRMSLRKVDGDWRVDEVKAL